MYLSHYPVTHPFEPEQARVVFNCAAQFAHVFEQLLQAQTGPILGHLNTSQMGEEVTYIQDKELPEAHNLESALSAGASINNLNPSIEDDLLRAGGHIGRSHLPYELKHPVIFPYKHHVTELIAQEKGTWARSHSCHPSESTAEQMF